MEEEKNITYKHSNSYKVPLREPKVITPEDIKRTYEEDPEVLLRVEHLEQFFQSGKYVNRAVNDVSFTIYAVAKKPTTTIIIPEINFYKII